MTDQMWDRLEDVNGIGPIVADHVQVLAEGEGRS
jgi:hypothetical protein